MKRTLALFALLSVFAGANASALTTSKTKVTDVWVCPMTLSAVMKGKEAGKPVVVGNKRVHFCCPGCPEGFAKLSVAQKKVKVAAAVKKAAEIAKSKKS